MNFHAQMTLTALVFMGSLGCSDAGTIVRKIHLQTHNITSVALLKVSPFPPQYVTPHLATVFSPGNLDELSRALGQCDISSHESVDMRTALASVGMQDLENIAAAVGVKVLNGMGKAQLLDMLVAAIGRVGERVTTTSPPFQLLPVPGLVEWATAPYLRKLQDLVVGSIETAVVSTNTMYGTVIACVPGNICGLVPARI